MKGKDFKRAWGQLQGRIRAEFPKITDEDAERIRGDKDELLKCLEERYGKSRRQALHDLNHFLDSVHSKA